MSEELKALHARRKTFFLEDLRNRRELTRVDVYMNALKAFANKQVHDLDDNDVLDFLIYKDINESGRTHVHHKDCPYIGASNFERCSDKTLCAKRHQAASMRVGIVAKLRRGFEDVGRKGIYNPRTLQGDPTRGAVVSEYIGFIRMEQGMSGVLPKQAVTMTKNKMDKFMTAMGLDIQGRKGITRLRMKERRAMYAFCFTAIKRLAGAGHIIAPNTIRIPINDGLVFNCTWDKTLRMGVHCFGFLCVKGIDKWCAHCIIDEWVLCANTFQISFEEGLLFPRLKSKGVVDCNKRWKAKNILDSLERDLKRYGLYQGETAQSFRHGGTVNSLETGQDLERTMYLAYMKNKTTAQNYAKGLCYLFPKQNWKKAGVDTTNIDSVTLALQMQSWRAWKNEGPPVSVVPIKSMCL